MHPISRLHGALVGAAMVGAAGLLGVAGSPAAAAACEPIKGAGSTFAQRIIEAWAADVGNVTYEGIGSGKGRARLVAGEVDFAASDVPASPDERKALDSRGGAVHVPVTAGGLAIVYHVPEVSDLKLSGPTLAKIFSGQVTNWNDPAIALDHGAPGPDRPITVVVRGDKSGSTGILTGYLHAAGGGEWKAGVSEQFPAGPGQSGATGSAGMADAVAQTDGAVGYVDHGIARDRGLAEALVKNGSDQARPPDAPSVSAALDEASTHPDGTVEMNYRAGGEAYPIASVSYLITTGKFPGCSENLNVFLDHALGAGQDEADPLGYAPLPEKLRGFARDQAGKVSAG